MSLINITATPNASSAFSASDERVLPTNVTPTFDPSTRDATTLHENARVARRRSSLCRAFIQSKTLLIARRCRRSGENNGTGSAVNAVRRQRATLPSVCRYVAAPADLPRAPKKILSRHERR